MKRKIYDELVKWKNNTDNIKPLMILGVRQCGKTYIINEFCQKEFDNYVYVNLFDNNEVVDLYNSNLNSDEKYNRLKLLLDFDIDKENVCLFIDEIQQCEALISELKYFCEKHNNVRIICAGSLLGVKLKRAKTSFPVGKVKMLTMYPMNFEEFLWAMNQELLIDTIKDCYLNNKQISSPVHEKALTLYRIYLFTGGMPESVKNMVSIKGDYIKYDSSILEDILTSYFNDMSKYVTSESEVLKIRRVYNSLPSQLSNVSNKFQYSKIEKKGKARDYDTSIDWLLASNMVLSCKCVKLPEIPLEGFVDNDIFKLYLSDVGILNSILKISISDILNDNISLYKGVIVENYVANELVSNGHNLYYYRNSNNTNEIDFLLYNEDGIIPIEIKASNNTKSKSLGNYIEQFNPKYSIRISTKDFGYDPKNKIKSIPLYATFLL
ncbi:MAG: AAA family ATPase [Bacilli bacterium]|jgi:ATPase|nr:AAA family ATPase [Bacillota bacterium]MDY4859221.1 AAA family ATPase [Bacilli bacterium]MDY5335452.1 AAA family ATPase [Bacilli bacterium]